MVSSGGVSDPGLHGVGVMLGPSPGVARACAGAGARSGHPGGRWGGRGAPCSTAQPPGGASAARVARPAGPRMRSAGGGHGGEPAAEEEAAGG